VIGFTHCRLSIDVLYLLNEMAVCDHRSEYKRERQFTDRHGTCNLTPLHQTSVPSRSATRGLQQLFNAPSIIQRGEIMAGTGSGSGDGTSKFGRKMLGGSRLSEDEVALRALRAYNSKASDPRIYNRIKNYAGGTLYLVEFTTPPSDDQEYWSVLLRNDEAQVFYDHEMALREAVTWNRRVTSVSFGTIVISVISIIIVGAVVYFVWRDGESPQPFDYALTSVLGFWFGKSVSKAKT